MAELAPPYSKEQLVRIFTHQDLPEQSIESIINTLDPDPVRFSPGEVLMKQGAPGDAMFFIARGHVEVSITPFGAGSPLPARKVAELTAGDVVGEMALVNNTPRNATVTALDEVMAYRLSQDKWRYVDAFLPGLAARIKEVVKQRSTISI